MSFLKWGGVKPQTQARTGAPSTGTSTTAAASAQLVATVFHENLDALLLEATKHQDMTVLRDAVHMTRVKGYQPSDVFRTLVLACELCRGDDASANAARLSKSSGNNKGTGGSPTGGVGPVRRQLLLQSVTDIGKLAALNLLPVRPTTIQIACDLARRLVFLLRQPAAAPDTAPFPRRLSLAVPVSGSGGSLRADSVTLVDDADLVERTVQMVVSLLALCHLGSTSLSELLGLLFTIHAGAAPGSVVEATSEAALSRQTLSTCAALCDYVETADHCDAESSLLSSQLHAMAYFKDLCRMSLGEAPRWMKLVIVSAPHPQRREGQQQQEQSSSRQGGAIGLGTSMTGDLFCSKREQHHSPQTNTATFITDGETPPLSSLPDTGTVFSPPPRLSGTEEEGEGEVVLCSTPPRVRAFILEMLLNFFSSNDDRNSGASSPGSQNVNPLFAQCLNEGVVSLALLCPRDLDSVEDMDGEDTSLPSPMEPPPRRTPATALSDVSAHGSPESQGLGGPVPKRRPWEAAEEDEVATLTSSARGLPRTDGVEVRRSHDAEYLFYLSQSVAVRALARFHMVMRHAASLLVRHHLLIVKECRLSAGVGSPRALAVVLHLWAEATSEEALMTYLLINSSRNNSNSGGAVGAIPEATAAEPGGRHHPAEPLPPFADLVYESAQLLVETAEKHLAQARYPNDDEDGDGDANPTEPVTIFNELLSFIVGFGEQFASLFQRAASASPAVGDTLAQLRHIYTRMHAPLLQVSKLVLRLAGRNGAEAAAAGGMLPSILRLTAHWVRVCTLLSLPQHRDEYLHVFADAITATEGATREAFAVVASGVSTECGEASSQAPAPKRSAVGAWGANLANNMRKLTGGSTSDSNGQSSILNTTGTVSEEGGSAVRRGGADCSHASAATLLIGSRHRSAVHDPRDRGVAVAATFSPVTSLSSSLYSPQAQHQRVLRASEQLRCKLVVIKTLLTVSSSLSDSLAVSSWVIVARALSRTEYVIARLQVLLAWLTRTSLGRHLQQQQQLVSEVHSIRDALCLLCLTNALTLSDECCAAFFSSLAQCLTRVMAEKLAQGRAAVVVEHDSDEAPNGDSSGIDTNCDEADGGEGTTLLWCDSFGGLQQMKLVEDCLLLAFMSLEPSQHHHLAGANARAARATFVITQIRLIHSCMESGVQISWWHNCLRHCPPVLATSPLSFFTSSRGGTGGHARTEASAWAGSAVVAATKSTEGRPVASTMGPATATSTTAQIEISDVVDVFVGEVTAVAAYVCAGVVQPAAAATPASPLTAAAPITLSGPLASAPVVVLADRLIPRARALTTRQRREQSAEKAGQEASSTTAAEDAELTASLRALPFTLLRDCFVQGCHTYAAATSAGVRHHHHHSGRSSVPTTDGGAGSDCLPDRALMPAQTSVLALSVCTTVLRVLLQLVQGYGAFITSRPWEPILQLLHQAAISFSVSVPTTTTQQQQSQEPQDTPEGRRRSSSPESSSAGVMPVMLGECVSTAFRTLEMIQHNYITNMDGAGLSHLIRCAGAFVTQRTPGPEDARVHLNLSAVQMLWSVADFIASTPTPPQHLAGAAAPVPKDTLWCSLLLQLLTGCLEVRREVRQSAVKTLFSLIQAYGSQFASECWHCVLAEVLPPLMNVVEEGVEWDMKSSLDSTTLQAAASLSSMPSHRSSSAPAQPSPSLPIASELQKHLMGLDAQQHPGRARVEAASLARASHALTTNASSHSSIYLFHEHDDDGSSDQLGMATSGGVSAQATVAHMRTRAQMLVAVFQRSPAQLDDLRIALIDAVSRVFLCHYTTAIHVLVDDGASSSAGGGKDQRASTSLVDGVLLRFIELCGEACVVVSGTLGEAVAAGAVRALHGLLVELPTAVVGSGTGRTGLAPALTNAAWVALEKLLLRDERCQHTAKRQCTTAVVSAIVAAVCDGYCMLHYSPDVRGGGDDNGALLAADCSSSNTDDHLSRDACQHMSYLRRLAHVFARASTCDAVMESYYFPNKVQVTILECIQAVWPMLLPEEARLVLTEVVVPLFPTTATMQRYVMAQPRTAEPLQSVLPPSGHPSVLLSLLDFLLSVLREPQKDGGDEQPERPTRCSPPPPPRQPTASPCTGAVGDFVASFVVQEAGALLLLQYKIPASPDSGSGPVSSGSYRLPATFVDRCLDAIPSAVWDYFLVDAPAQEGESPRSSQAALLARRECSVEAVTSVFKSHLAVAAQLASVQSSGEASGKVTEGGRITATALETLFRLVDCLEDVVRHLVERCDDVQCAAMVLSSLVTASALDSPQLARVAQRSLAVLRRWSSPRVNTQERGCAKALAPREGVGKKGDAMERFRGLVRTSIQERTRCIVEQFLSDPASDYAAVLLTQTLASIVEVTGEMGDGPLPPGAEEAAVIRAILADLVRLSGGSSARLVRSETEAEREREVRGALSEALTALHKILGVAPTR